MGYDVDMLFRGVRIAGERVAPCLAAINALWADPEKVHALTHRPGGEYPDLVVALDAWGIAADELNPGFGLGGLHLRAFTPGSFKRRHELLFETIAPFVSDGGQVWVIGEDGAIWRYVFEQGAIRTERGHLHWEQEASMLQRLREHLREASRQFAFGTHNDESAYAKARSAVLEALHLVDKS